MFIIIIIIIITIIIYIYIYLHVNILIISISPSSSHGSDPKEAKTQRKISERRAAKGLGAPGDAPPARGPRGAGGPRETQRGKARGNPSH